MCLGPFEWLETDKKEEPARKAEIQKGAELTRRAHLLDCTVQNQRRLQNKKNVNGKQYEPNINELTCTCVQVSPFLRFQVH